MGQGKVPVPARALLRRINRVLEAEAQVLKKTKRAPGARAHVLGDYYLLSTRDHVVVRRRVELESLGRKLGALEPYETLIGEDA